MKRKWLMFFGKKKRQIKTRRRWLNHSIYISLALVVLNTGLALFTIYTLRTQNTAVTLPNFYSEGMVFQHDKPAFIHGKTSPNTQLTIAIGGSSSSTTSDAKGDFAVNLATPPARLQAYRLAITNTQTNRELAHIDKVYSGNVFLMSGQSNMELNKANYYGNKDAIRTNTYDGNKKIIDIKQLPSAINDQDVHFIVTKNTTASQNSYDLPLQSISQNGWATADNTKNTDWLGYLPQQFVINMRKAEPDIPVGIIQTAWGGTNITRHMANGDIFNNHIAPLSGYNVAGILWYQGEADTTKEDAPKYAERLSLMIGQYRAIFGNDASLPFIQFQLADFKYGGDYWDDVRSAQAKVASSTYNTALIDAKGTEKGSTALIHPLGKDTLGQTAAKEMMRLLNN